MMLAPRSRVGCSEHRLTLSLFRPDQGQPSYVINIMDVLHSDIGGN